MFQHSPTVDCPPLNGASNTDCLDPSPPHDVDTLPLFTLVSIVFSHDELDALLSDCPARSRGLEPIGPGLALCLACCAMSQEPTWARVKHALDARIGYHAAHFDGVCMADLATIWACHRSTMTPWEKIGLLWSLVLRRESYLRPLRSAIAHDLSMRGFQSISAPRQRTDIHRPAPCQCHEDSPGPR